MATTTRALALDHSLHVARTWVNEVAKQFGTDDHEFAYGVLRAWLHTLRDRLTIEAAAHFSAQLPDLIRGVFYAGWDPSVVPVKFSGSEYVVRFAREANISVQDVNKAAAAVTAALQQLLPPALIDKVLDQLPREIRIRLRPTTADSR